MINNKKVFLGILSLALSTSIGFASAQEAPAASSMENEAILFRISDITPVTNADKNVYACDFSITFYNHTSNIVSGASLDLTWEDNSLDDIISAEMKENIDGDNRMRRSSSSRTARNNPSMVSLSVEVPAIKSVQQTQVKSRIQSDRCFLLMNDPTVKVKSCRINTPEESSRSRTSAASLCSDLFKFVSPKSAEYYSDFKDVSEEADARKMSQRERIKTEIKEEYDRAVSEFDKASTSLNEIK